jgi:hypothetical protein
MPYELAQPATMAHQELGISLSNRHSLLAALAVCAGTALAAQPANERDRFELSGVQRSRYETIDEQFGGGLSGADHVLALQTSLTFDYQLDKLHLYGEIMDSRGLLNDEQSSVGTSLVNTLEPIQAYVAWTLPSAASARSTLRVGRLTLDIGKRRLISRNRFRNTLSTFTGADWQWQGSAGQNARAIYLIPMRILPTGFDDLLDDEFDLDRGQRDTAVRGGYYQFPKAPSGDTVEVYGYAYDSTDTRTDPSTYFDDLWSVGARVFRPAAKGKWNYEVEAVSQTGTSGGVVAGVQRRDLDHRAHLLHFEVGYQFDSAWAPNLMLLFDDASGDEDPLDGRNERFNTLFGDRRFELTTTGIYGPFNRSNLQGPGLRVTVTPTSRLQGMLHYRSYRLAAERDAWVGVGARDPLGRAGDSLGRQLEGSLTWSAIADRLTLEAGFERLWFGRFAEQTGVAVNGDPTFFYCVATTRF